MIDSEPINIVSGKRDSCNRNKEGHLHLPRGGRFRQRWTRTPIARLAPLPRQFARGPCGALRAGSPRHGRKFQVKRIQRIDHGACHDKCVYHLLSAGTMLPRRMRRRRSLRSSPRRRPGNRSHSARSRRSAGENFQFFAGSSSRARKRFFCSLLGQVQEKLEHEGTVARQVPLERVDILEPFLPEMLSHKRGRNVLRLQHLAMQTRTMSVSS